jgi:capsular polysaccharide biosynthesis protein
MSKSSSFPRRFYIAVHPFAAWLFAIPVLGYLLRILVGVLKLPRFNVHLRRLDREVRRLDPLGTRVAALDSLDVRVAALEEAWRQHVPTFLNGGDTVPASIQELAQFRENTHQKALSASTIDHLRDEAAICPTANIFDNAGPVSRREIIPIKVASLPGLDDILSARLAAQAPMFPPAFSRPAAPLLFADDTPTEIAAHHHAGPVKVKPIIISIPRALVSGFNLVGTRRYVFDLPTEPGYVASYLRRDSQFAGARTLMDRRCRWMDGLSVLVTHWNSNTYGHWLLENLPKLLAIRHLRPRLPPFRLISSRYTARDIAHWAELLLPGVPLVFFDHDVEYLQCERLLLPGPLLTDDWFIHPVLADLMSCIPGISATGDRRLFITRPDAHSFHRLGNRDEVHAIAADAGYELYAPEQHPVAQQVAAFASASIIAGDFGSALHNTMFSPADAKVVCLNWMSPHQSRIGAFKKHQTRYVMPREGPCLYNIDEGAPQQTFYMDPEKVRAALLHAL